MNDLPLVTVVTPSYNQARYLGETIRSVLGQEYPNLEFLVIDGGSTDGSVDVIRRCEEHIDWWVSEPDSGQADAINKGLRRAKGEYVAWLNSDDLYMPDAIQHAVAVLEEHPEASMVYGDGILVDSEKRVLDWHRYPQLSTLDLMCWRVLLQPAVFMRRSALERAGYLDLDYHLILDHELWIRMALQGPLIHVDEFWAAERTHADAKTMASAAGFVEEAERLVSVFQDDDAYGAIYPPHEKLVRASLQSFAARRLIDSQRYGQALRHFTRSFWIKPAVVTQYWYKVFQALMGAVGLEPVFMWYRRTRRRMQHQEKKLAWNGDRLKVAE